MKETYMNSVRCFPTGSSCSRHIANFLWFIRRQVNELTFTYTESNQQNNISNTYYHCIKYTHYFNSHFTGEPGLAGCPLK